MCGWNVTDCKICFEYGLYYSPVSTPADFRSLAPIVLEQALKESGTQLLLSLIHIFQTTCCYSLESNFYPKDGNYIALTVTNNGSAMQTATAGRTLTLGGFESGHWRGRNAGQNLLYRRQCGGIGEYTGLRHLCQGSFQSQRYYSFSETV